MRSTFWPITYLVVGIAALVGSVLCGIGVVHPSLNAIGVVAFGAYALACFGASKDASS